jgi:prepilin-type N-terminal cleavage/methylation domain-containing protein
MRRQQTKEAGFSLVELVMVIIIIGILAAIGTRKMNDYSEITKAQNTLAEMQDITKAIAGDENLYVDGRRTDFGYIGSNGSLPTNLSDLGNSELETDAWGDAYGWSKASLTVVSTGNGDSVSVTLYSRGSLVQNDYESNTINGLVMDVDGLVPTLPDSVSVVLTYMAGGTTTATVGTSGEYTFTGIPIGNHTIRASYSTQTVPRFVSVVPEISSYGVQHVFSSW